MPLPTRTRALLVLSLGTQACMVWRPASVPPRLLLEYDRPRQVRLVKNDGTTRKVTDPVIVADEIGAVVRRCHDLRLHGQLVCDPYTDTLSVVALDEVRTVEVRRFSGGRTVALVAVNAGMFYLLLVEIVHGIKFKPVAPH